MTMDKILDELVFDILRVKRTLRVSDEWRGMVNIADPFSRLYLALEGEAEIVVAGAARVMRAGHLYLLPSKTRITFVTPPGAFAHIWAHFKTRLPGNSCLFNFMDCPFELPSSQAAATHFQRLLSLWPPDNAGALLECKGLLLLLLAPFAAAATNKPEANDAFAMLSRFKPALRHLEEHMRDKVTLDRLGKLAGMHPTYFSNRFKQCFGVPPLHYLCRMRVMKAQELLLNTSAKVQAIAAEVGYDDVCFFSRLFKQHTGISPAAYRQAARPPAEAPAPGHP